MHLPYNRPRLIEIHEQPWCPSYIRQPIQTFLTFLWTRRIPLVQSRAPYEAVVDLLGRAIDQAGGDVRIVDFCSGAGGPMPAIEKRLNAQRTALGQTPVLVMLSDLYPHVSDWQGHAADSPSSALAYIPYPVDVTAPPTELTKYRHLRTLFLAYHQMDEAEARLILEDAMRNAEGLCIVELQEPSIGSFLTLTLLFPLCYLLTPFTRPSLTTLFFTYILPLIPFALTFDGLVSAYRTRPPEHVMHLANLASIRMSLEKEMAADEEWKWTWGYKRHTWPFGRMVWVIGRKERE